MNGDRAAGIILALSHGEGIPAANRIFGVVFYKAIGDFLRYIVGFPRPVGRCAVRPFSDVGRLQAGDNLGGGLGRVLPFGLADQCVVPIGAEPDRSL